MKKMILIVAAFFINACTMVDNYMLGKDNTPKPAPLPVIASSERLQKKWSQQLPSGNVVKNVDYPNLKPQWDNGIIYTATSSGVVVAVDAKSGDKKWQTELKTWLASGPAIQGNYIALGGVNAELLLLNKKSGQLLWRQNVANELLASPIIADDAVYAKTIDGKVYAFSLTTGEKRWSYDNGASRMALRSAGSPAMYHGILLVGFADGKLVGLNKATGQLLWQRTLNYPAGTTDVERMVDIDANPIVKDQTLYVAGYQGSVMALSLVSGKFLWHRKLSSYKNMSLSNKVIYVTDSDSQLWALNADNGSVLWRQNKMKYRSLSAPTVANGRVMVTDAFGYLHVLSAENGHIFAQKKVSNTAIVSAPQSINNQIYVFVANGRLIDLEVQT